MKTPAQSMASAHPRSRGEHCSGFTTTTDEFGSSPLARGTPGFIITDAALIRLIPARAGNTIGRTQAKAAQPAHPRSRGEHYFASDVQLPYPGSSPLARGTHCRLSHCYIVVRLIPARAGNTLDESIYRGALSAHPRSRGEHITKYWSAAPYFGSSPLARGTRMARSRAQPLPRLIPARAGNTGKFSKFFPVSAAHPRSRGEHLGIINLESRRVGSSPLARGTLGRPHRKTAAPRLIPARAGNTHRKPQNGRCHTAHPRSRGEHGKGLRSGHNESGSSPLARGTQLLAI